MNKIVIIYDSNETKRISQLLNDKLNSNNIASSISDNNNIDKLIDNNTFILTISKGNIVEIIYPLNKSNTVAKSLYNELINNNINIDKYYQRRDSINTLNNYDDILNKYNNDNNIIIKYNSDDIKIVDVLFNYFKEFYGVTNNVYIVKKGDTLYSIARIYNTTVDSIKSINKLKSNTIYIGEKLIIPSSFKKEYIVKKGDTLYSIAKKYNTTVLDIMNVNNLNSSNISIGKVLSIP